MRCQLNIHLPAMLALSIASTSCGRAPTYDLAISGATIIDTLTGETKVNNIGIRDGFIAYIGDDEAHGEIEINAEGLWAVPGLWDMHAHIADESFFSLFVENGVVGVRDMGGAIDRPTDGCESIDISSLRKWRDEIEAGRRIGPRLVLAGPIASGPGRPTALAATTPENAREAVRKISVAGADFVKVYEDIPPTAFAALASEAKIRGLPFAGHVSVETLTVKEAIAAGQRSVEHVRSHLLLCFARTDEELETLFDADHWDDNDREWAKRHIAGCPYIWDAFRDREVWLTPTLAVQETLLAGEKERFEDDPRRNSLPAAIRQAVRTRSDGLRNRDGSERAAAALWNQYIFRLVNRAAEEKAKILAGSDAACEGVIPGFSLHRELQLLVDAGLSPLQALQAATLEPGRYFEKDDEIGRIAVGFNADLILVRGNPLSKIANLDDIEKIILRGEVISKVDQ
ncbi:MAG: amidohydrolase family protein [Parvularculaceae bacterium]